MMWPILIRTEVNVDRGQLPLGENHRDAGGTLGRSPGIGILRENTVPEKRRRDVARRSSHALSVPDIRILHALRQLARILDINSRKLARRKGVTSVQLFCLNTIALSGADTATAVASKVHLSASTIVGILDRLERKKLVTRERDLEDRRVVRLKLTDAGNELVATTLHPVQALLEQKFNGLTQARAAEIAEALESLVRMLDDGDAREPPLEPSDYGDSV
jgi:DNA-binding MarR family transcriptional regulator